MMKSLSRWKQRLRQATDTPRRLAGVVTGVAHGLRIETASARVRPLAWAGLLVCALGFAGSLPAQEQINGTRYQPKARGITRFLAAEKFTQRFATNRLSFTTSGPPRATEFPLPLETPVPSPAPEMGAKAGTSSAPMAAPSIGDSPPPAASFEALADNNTVIPPDTIGAVGPAHLMVTLNSEVRIQDRNGTNISTVALDAFWAPLGFPSVFDPKVYYDSSENRWIFVAMADSQTTASAVLIAVSQNSDPTGVWYQFRITADSFGTYWADYPTVGFNRDWLVVGANMFPNLTGAYGGANIYVFSKAALYANTLNYYTVFGVPAGFTMVPAVTYDTNLTTMYLVDVPNLVANYAGVSSQLRISTLTGTVNAPVLTLGAAFTPGANPWTSADPVIVQGGIGGFLPQFGSPFGIAGNDSRIMNAVYRNGTIWCTHHVFLPAGIPDHAAVQWWQLDPLSALAPVRQGGVWEDTSGVVSYAYPSIAVNAREDVFIGCSRFSVTDYASGVYAVRFSGDLPGQLRREALLKAGEAPYLKVDGTYRNRWGDYSGSVVDPLNDNDFWTIQEYAAYPLAGWDRWGTWWGQIVMGNLTQFQFPNFTVVEGVPPGVASINVYNFGGAAGTVDYYTTDGTALDGVDYIGRSGTLVFTEGQTITNFEVIVIDNAWVDASRTVNLHLVNASTNLTLGYQSNAVLTIIDDESIIPASPAGEFNFSDWLDLYFYEVTENESDFDLGCYPGSPPALNRSALGALMTVVRTNGSTGRVMVDFATVAGGVAVPYFDYIPTNGTLVFDDYQMRADFLVTVLSDMIPNGHKFVNVALSNPRPDAEEELQRPDLLRPTLGPGAQTGFYIWEIDHGYGSITNTPGGIITNSYVNAFAFERRWYRLDEYTNRDPTIPSIANSMNLTVLLEPNGGAGQVDVVFFNYVSGGQMAAGSDHAESPPAGYIVWPNTVMTGNGPLTTMITNVWDYTNNTIRLGFGNGQCRANVRVVVTNDTEVEFNEDIVVELFPVPNNPPVNPYGAIANVTALFDEQPAGALDREWNPDGVEGTVPSFNPAPGANHTVNAVATQADGKTLLGGDFDHVNSQYRPHIARLNADGSLDTTFNPGVGANGAVNAVLVYPSNSPLAGLILIAGSFSSYNGSQRNGIARLLPNGQLDPNFFPGTGAGANGSVRTMTLQADGKVVLAGDFVEFNDIGRNGIVRLNTDGSFDWTFDAGGAADGAIWTLATITNQAGFERIVVGGDFWSFQSQFVGHIALLSPDGSLDPGFSPGAGANGSVYATAVQSNGMFIIAGAFTEFDSRVRQKVARLLPDGTLDEEFDPGLGTDAPVFALALQPDQLPIIGGPFSSFNGTRRVGLARLRRDGALDTSFMDTGYNQFAGLIRTRSFEPPNYVNSLALQPDGNVMVGGSFYSIGGNPSFRAPLRNHYTVFTRSDKRSRLNIARVLGGVTPGPGNVEFDSVAYYADENCGTASLRLQRTDGRLGGLLAEVATLDRTATNMVDYLGTNLVSEWPYYFYWTNDFDILFLWQYVDPTNYAPLSVGKVIPNYLQVPIIDNRLQDGDRMTDLSLVRPNGNLILGGEYIPLGGALGRSMSRLTIGDNDFPAGVFNFSSPSYVTNENSTNVIITVIRTNGSVGPVSVEYYTVVSPVAPVAVGGSDARFHDYLPAQGRLDFRSGETNKTFTIRIWNDTTVEFDENVGLVLTNAAGGAQLPGGQATSTATAIFTIVDDDYPSGRLNYSATTFTTNENAGAAVITVSRTGGNRDAISAEYRMSGLTAAHGVDFLVTSGTLRWDDGESVPKSFTVPLLGDGVVDGLKMVHLCLTNAYRGLTPAPGLFGARTNSVLNILDDDAYGTLAFSQPFYQADENAGGVTITVVRQAGIAGTVSVDYTVTAVDPLSPGVDFVPTSGRLTLLPGEVSKTFAIALLDDDQADGNKDLVLALSNPANATVGLPASVTLTLIDDESFNVPSGQLDTTFDAGAGTDGPVYSLALQPDGRLLLAGDFTELNNIPRSGMGRLLADGTFDASFNPGAGANGSIRAMALQRDGRVLVGGFFTQMQSTNRNRIARLNHDGSMDASFNPGAGADNPVFALLVQPDDKVLLGGAFSAFNSISRAGIVRLNTNGTVDTTFSSGGGANGSVFALAQQPNGKILIGGDFTAINGVPRIGLARLNQNGTLDESFDPGEGFNAAVRAILIQPDGRVVVGGSFTNALGVTRNYLARLETNGTLDVTFLAAPLKGADAAVYALALQVDGRLIVGGDFTRFNGVTRNRLTRLHVNGSSDATINFGNGADSFVATLAIQPDRKIVLGGGFTTFDDQPRKRVARIHGGSVAGAGSLEFSRPLFLVNENGTNASIIVRRRGGTEGSVSVGYRTADDTAFANVDYLPVSGTLTFKTAETRRSFIVPVIDNSLPSRDRALNLELVQGSYTGGATSGPQPRAVLQILDDEGQIGFAMANQSVGESVPSGSATIVVTRSGGTNQLASVRFSSADGTATTPLDYFPTNGTLVFLPGELSKSFRVLINNDTNIEGNEVLYLSLTNASGSNVIGTARSALTIVDDDFAPGQLNLTSFAYTNAEGSEAVAISVIRTNGSTGVISVRYRTGDGTALAGLDYEPTNNILAFADGETAKTFFVTVIDDLLAEPTETFLVSLYGITGGASMGSVSNATVYIVDNDLSQIVPGGAALLTESFAPPNGAIDPGETVTVLLGLRNIGNVNVPGVVGTLIAGSGVTQPSGPQSYGTLVGNGPVVAREFSFRAAIGNPGERIIATLFLTDLNGVTNVVEFPFTLGGRTTNMFTSTNVIIVNDNGPASPYPSSITIPNVGGLITQISVTLNNVNHAYPDDLDILLVGPNGRHAFLMSDAGGSRSLNGATFTFSDAALTVLPDSGQISNRFTYVPTNYAGAGTADFFPSPGPQPPYTNSALSVFNKTSPIGEWRLFVGDDTAYDAGWIGGWSLSFSTEDPLVQATDLGLTSEMLPSPAWVGAMITNVVTLTNQGPATATTVVMTNLVGSGLSFVSATVSRGTYTEASGMVTWSVPKLSAAGKVTATFVLRATMVGTTTNRLGIYSDQLDVNSLDNKRKSAVTIQSLPRLTVTRQGPALLLSWPGAASGFVAQGSPSLNSPAWTTLGSGSAVGDQQRLSVSLPSTNRFFRLKQQ